MWVYGERSESIEEMDGILNHNYIANIPMAKQRMHAINPEELREQGFHYTHSHPESGHFGKNKHLNKISPEIVVVQHSQCKHVCQ